jgi:hypothetical protein
MQLMHLLQIWLANVISTPYIMLTCARNHIQYGDYMGCSSKVCYTLMQLMQLMQLLQIPLVKSSHIF